GVVQRLHRPVFIVDAAVGISEATGEQQIGELGDQILEIQFVEQVAGEFCVTVFHKEGSWVLTSAWKLSCNTSSCLTESGFPPRGIPRDAPDAGRSARRRRHSRGRRFG